MLTVEMTSIPASSSSSMSCQRFSWRDPGALVCASSSTSATVGPAGEQRVEVHLLERRTRGARSRARGSDLEPLDHLRGVLAPVGLDQPDDDVGAAGEPAAALVEHGDGLAHPGGRPEVDAMPTARHGLILTDWPAGAVGGLERDVELGDVDPVLADEAQGGAAGCARRPAAAPAAASSRAPAATRGAW